MDIKFDIIFVGYVIEHLSNGIQLYNALANLKLLLKNNGILVIQFPDSMKLGMEFYNIDYTHMLLTTKRNVNQAILDNSMYVQKAIDLCGILYTRKVDSAISYFIKSGVMFFYSYRIMNLLAKIFYRVPVWNLKNVFWRAYALLKEPNVMFIVKKKFRVVEGICIIFTKGSIDICFKFIGDGEFTIYLRAKDVRDDHSLLAHFEWELSRHMCLEQKKAEINFN